ncbi:MAG: DUF2244 domain-containing protein [Pseudomonadota bacterium]
MALHHDTAAGAKAPAARFEGEGVEITWSERSDAPHLDLDLWPNRSLSLPGRRRFLWLMTACFAVPLLPLTLTPAIWIPLAFCLAVLGAVAYALRRNTADGRLVERVTLWPDELRVERTEASGIVKRWRADPYWVRLTLHEKGRPENYLTLKGGGREIELGAFLSPEERVVLSERLETAIRDVLQRAAAERC